MLRRAKTPMATPTPMPACAPVERPVFVFGNDGGGVEEDVETRLGEVAAPLLVVLAVLEAEETEVVKLAVAPSVTANVIAASVPQQSVLFFPQHHVFEYFESSQGV
jgi:GTP:adenosylcobinamide-phosphate guanylyltransferase